MKCTDSLMIVALSIKIFTALVSGRVERLVNGSVVQVILSASTVLKRKE